MTTAPSTDRSTGGPTPLSHPGLSRPGRWSLTTHHLLLAAVLAAIIPIAGTGAVWSADEGALLYQATAVADGRGWTFDHPFPAVDPNGTWFPIHLAGFAADGDYVVLGKHTSFVRLVGVLHGIGGYPAVLALSVISGFAAAAAAARLAGRVDPRATVAALWLTGVASPLFLSSYVAWAHTLGAALVGWALVGLTATAGSKAALVEVRLGGAIALAAAIGVRTEALLAAVAITAALAIPTVLGRLWPRASDGLTMAGPGLGHATLAAGATMVGFAIDRVGTVDRSGPVRPPGDRWGGLVGRLEGFAHTWLRPDFSAEPQHLLFGLAAMAMIGAAASARARGVDHPRVGALLGIGAAAVIGRFLISPMALIPGLVVAFPVLFAGLLLVRRRDLARGPAAVLLAFVALFWGAVLATQYRHGGGGEWGGRYFAIGLPAAVAVAAPGLVRAVDSLRGPARRPVLGAGALIVVLPVVMGVLGMADVRVRTRALTDRVEAERTEAGVVDPGDGRLPVVLTTLSPLGRWAWRDVDRSRWLLVDETELAEAASALRAAGIERLVLVTGQVDDDLPPLAPWFRPMTPVPDDQGSSLDRVVIPLNSSPGENSG